ncbi:MAG: DUF559 domain-containing protein [Candidatus Margulisbacteria bacterium]|nr:DUF559 domain-containing protein [Candidatus Margulisiibacteriota bacterium]
MDKNMRMDYRKREFARMLRVDQTPYEEQVWELLRNRKFMGLKFRRQHVIEGFVVDFYCHEYRFGVELDGKIHDKQKDYDGLRDEEIGAEDITPIRIRNQDIEKYPEIVLRKIKEHISKLQPQTLPLSLWERGLKEKIDLEQEVGVRAGDKP